MHKGNGGRKMRSLQPRRCIGGYSAGAGARTGMNGRRRKVQERVVSVRMGVMRRTSTTSVAEATATSASRAKQRVVRDIFMEKGQTLRDLRPWKQIVWSGSPCLAAQLCKRAAPSFAKLDCE